MDHVASLEREAREVRRRLLVASETASGKLARIFQTLLTSDVDIEALDKSAADNAGIGHTFAVMFLLAGVRGMPAIGGKDALEWAEEWKAANPGDWHGQVNKMSKALPRAYGSDIAGPIWSAAMQIAGKNRERAEDLVMGVLTNFLKGAGQSIKAEPIAGAIKYVQNSIRNMGINVIKKQDRRERSLTRDTDEGEEIQEELKSDHDLDDVMEDHHARMIVEEIMQDPKIKSELERVHVDALQYLTLISQGYEDPEILGVTARGQTLGKPMLHHPLSKGTSGVPLTPANWNVKKHQMFDIIKKHFAGGHEKYASYDYDRIHTAGRNGHIILEAGKATFQMPVTMPPRFTGAELDKTIHNLGREGLDRILKTVSRNVPKFQYGISDAYASDQGYGKGLHLVATAHWKGDGAQVVAAFQGFSDSLGYSLDNWL